MAGDSSSQNAALVAANLHFPGVERIVQDKASSTAGPPSSRTRAKCQTLPTALGTLPQPGQEYDGDGVLTEAFCILQIRWGELDVQCEVEWGSRPSGETSWVDLSAILGQQHAHLFAQFYASLLKKERALSLQEMDGMPSPRDIMNIAGRENFDFHFEKGESIPEWARCFSYRTFVGLVRRWDKQRSKLQALEVAKQKAQTRKAKTQKGNNLKLKTESKK
ncbi:hypothetical protein F5Y05DRAFT_298133 [Hypoxylon sp. FL0543]|nr:hypothetical protein F5Y05DRAFT_298133 [Hypoxylon sp. FL0543]